METGHGLFYTHTNCKFATKQYLHRNPRRGANASLNRTVQFLLSEYLNGYVSKAELNDWEQG